MMLGAKRMRAHAALFASIFGVTVVISGLGVGISGYLSAAAVTGVRAGLASASGQDGAVRIDVRRSNDPTAQDAAVRSIVEATASAPVRIERTVQGGAVDTSAGQLVLASVPRLQSHAALVEGTWGAGMLQADAAAALHLAPGETISIVGGPTVTLTGTWRATDPLDPYWFGDPLAAGGADDDGAGPLVVAESVWDSLPDAPFARWTVTAGAVSPADLPRLASLVDRLPDALDKSTAVGDTGTIVEGGLSDTASTVKANLAAVGGVSPVPLLLIGVMSLVTLAELGRLLVGVRASETALLRSRGAAAPGIAGSTAAEVAIVAVPAALIGTAAAIATVVLVTGRLPEAGPTIAIPIAAIVAAVGLATFSSALSARRAFRRDTANDSGRARSVAALGFVIVIVAAAAFAVWQFRLYGSPLVAGPSGELVTDPVAVLAAPLALLAIAVVALALFPLVTGIVERFSGRRPSLGVLPDRQLARRVTVFATPVLIVALAAGGATVAASYSQSWQSATATTREIRNGADVRLVQPALTPLSGHDALALPGVTAVTPVLAADTTLGDDPVSFVAYDRSTATQGIVASGATLAATVSVDRPAIGSFGVSAWFMAPTGVVQRVVLSESGSQWTGPVPSAGRLVALDVILPALSSKYGTSDAFAVTIGAIAVDGAPLQLTGWQPQQTTDFPGTLLASTTAVGATGGFTGTGGGSIRFMQPSPTGSASAPTVPVEITSALAGRAALAVGDPVSLAFSGVGRSVAGVVSRIVPAVPGMAGNLAAYADLGALEVQQLRTSTSAADVTELWLDSTNPSATAAGIRSKLGANARVTTIQTDAGSTLLESARVALWAGAIGALLLALVAVSAVSGALLRSRSAEVVVLRAIGLRARDQAAGRRRELGILLVFSLVAGLIGGGVVSLLTVSGLARSTVLDPVSTLPTPVLFDPVGLAACLLAVVIGFALIVGVYSARVARQATTLSAREEVR